MRNPIDFDSYWDRRENREWAIRTVLTQAPMDADDAEDVVQETLVRLWRGGHELFDPSIHPLPLEEAYRDWVKRMLKGAVANRITRGRRRLRLQQVWLGGAGSGDNRTRRA